MKKLTLFKLYESKYHQKAGSISLKPKRVYKPRNYSPLMNCFLFSERINFIAEAIGVRYGA